MALLSKCLYLFVDKLCISSVFIYFPTKRCLGSRLNALLLSYSVTKMLKRKTGQVEGCREDVTFDQKIRGEMRVSAWSGEVGSRKTGRYRKAHDGLCDEGPNRVVLNTKRTGPEQTKTRLKCQNAGGHCAGRIRSDGSQDHPVASH
ncbi:hypothetical protein RUM44_004625 [Polyplax serrata]|uniref:Uncharacterized protein n=1 Tax=Polyplax serrata TaxID=468196 RepID=A0ABR1B3T3_POLSC